MLYFTIIYLLRSQLAIIIVKQNSVQYILKYTFTLSDDIIGTSMSQEVLFWLFVANWSCSLRQLISDATEGLISIVVVAVLIGEDSEVSYGAVMIREDGCFSRDTGWCCLFTLSNYIWRNGDNDRVNILPLLILTGYYCQKSSHAVWCLNVIVCQLI